jgi:5-methylcytosine-specific restriction protein A
MSPVRLREPIRLLDNYDPAVVYPDVTERAAVLAAIEEFDRLGREAFLERHGFGRARGYFLVHDGKRYDSKAIAGVAYGYQHGTALTAGDFTGGDATVARLLERLGFTVERPQDLPNWTTDELLLALDLYLRHRGTRRLGNAEPEVVALSGLLRSLPIFPPAIRSAERFRNPTGVALKLHNFSALDPTHPDTGMRYGGSADAAVWDAWNQRPEQLAAIVDEIRSRAGDGALETPTGEPEEYEAEEGQLLYRRHRAYERDRKIVRKKKEHVQRTTGHLACEVCGFESAATFGPEASGVIDVHHIRPLHEVGRGIIRLRDLALLCPTCHRVVHKHKPWITPTELRCQRRA